ncbi:MAG: RibD family protein [Oscillochloridaceae bacterium umkhey_bin13]
MTQTARPKPVVTLSYAQTLDGRLATRTGSSQWIGGPQSLVFAHELRAQHAAIMVGVGTVLADDPRLTVRLVPGQNPLRVVVDSQLRTPLKAAVLRDGAAQGTVIFCSEKAEPRRRATLCALGAEVITLPEWANSGLDLEALLARLAERAITSLMVEGGAALITSLLRARLVDRIAVCVAPKILGEGISAVGALGIDQLAHAYTLADLTVRAYGVDYIFAGNVVYPDFGF